MQNERRGYNFLFCNGKIDVLIDRLSTLDTEYIYIYTKLETRKSKRGCVLKMKQIFLHPILIFLSVYDLFKTVSSFISFNLFFK